MLPKNAREHYDVPLLPVLVLLVLPLLLWAHMQPGLPGWAGACAKRERYK